MRFMLDTDLEEGVMPPTDQTIYARLRSVTGIAQSQGTVLVQERTILDVDGNNVGRWRITDNGTNEVTQEDVLADGSVVAVIISPEDVVSVAEDKFKRKISLDDAREYLESYANRVSEAMLEGWTDALACARGLDDFVDTCGTAIEGQARQKPPAGSCDG